VAARKKVQRKDKPETPKWTVIDAHGKLKYQPALGTELVGFDENLARSLAEGGWTAIPVADYARPE
jgi:hypothetical protein